MNVHHLHFLFLALSKFFFLKEMPVANQYIPAEYIVIADKITEEVSQKLSRRHGMSLIGIKGGLVDKVNILGLRFHIQGPREKEHLRKILVDCVEELLAAINESERIRPHLKNYPFTQHEIDIAIFVKDKNGRNVYHPYISTASADTDGKLRYATLDEGTRFKYKSEVEEDYEEAFRIVKGQ